MDKQAQETQEKLFDEVFLPAFVKSCADRGVPIQSEAAIAAALDIAKNVAHFKQAQAAYAQAENAAALQKAASLLQPQVPASTQAVAGILNGG